MKITVVRLTVHKAKQRLTGELAEMLAKSRHLEEEIRKNLGAIGYEL